MNEKRTNQQFNTSAELVIENRISSYKLYDNERSDIWEIVGNRDKLIREQKDYFNDNKERLVNREYDQLRGEQAPPQELNYGPAQPRNAILRGRAEINVLNTQHQALMEIQKISDKKIDRILDNAREQGRGPQSELKHDFQKAHDHDRG